VTANELTAALLIEIPKRFPRVRVWRQNTGGGIGMSTVKQAVAMIRSGQYAKAIALLISRPIKWGVEGAGDISGIARVTVLRHVGHPWTDTEFEYGVRLEIEVKIGSDEQSEEQKGFQSMIQGFGGIYIIARELEQCLKDLGNALGDAP
jgi:hypothetical protein